MIIAGNWKLNLGPDEAKSLIEQITEATTDEAQNQIIVFPSALAISASLQARDKSNIKIGIQNTHSSASGAFTGENSASVFKSMGGNIVLLGHSERRQLFSENNDSLAAKLTFIESENLEIMFCVGETLEDREAGKVEQILEEQIEPLKALSTLNKNLYVAYEPVWAIGTGKVASPEIVKETHKILRNSLSKKFGPLATSIPLLYGGSVKPENASELSKIDMVDGFLIGGASLKKDSFMGIVENSGL
ncbi:MAG: triose-phosphate isomerase [Bdellovibrionales bacterium]